MPLVWRNFRTDHHGRRVAGWVIRFDCVTLGWSHRGGICDCISNVRKWWRICEFCSRGCDFEFFVTRMYGKSRGKFTTRFATVTVIQWQKLFRLYRILCTEPNAVVISMTTNNKIHHGALSRDFGTIFMIPAIIPYIVLNRSSSLEFNELMYLKLL